MLEVDKAIIVLDGEDLFVDFDGDVVVADVKAAVETLIASLEELASGTITIGTEEFELGNIDVADVVSAILGQKSVQEFLDEAVKVVAVYEAGLVYNGLELELEGEFEFTVVGKKEFLDKLEAEFDLIDEAEVTFDEEDILVIFDVDVVVADVKAAAEALVAALRDVATSGVLHIGAQDFDLEDVDVTELGQALLDGVTASQFLAGNDPIIVAYTADVVYRGLEIELEGNFEFRPPASKGQFLAELEDLLDDVDHAFIVLDGEDVKATFASDVLVAEVKAALEALVDALKDLVDSGTLTIGLEDFDLATVDVSELAEALLGNKTAAEFLDDGVPIVVNYTADVVYNGLALELAGELRFEVSVVFLSFVETFDNMDLEVSTYQSGAHIGAGGQEWTYDDARGDLELDGKALLLRNGSLKTTLLNGLSKLSFEYDRAFTGTAARTFEVIINGVVIDTIVVNPTANERLVYENESLEYAGLVLLEIKGTGAQKMIDNVSWSEFDDGLERVIVTFDLGDSEEFLAQTVKGQPIVKPEDPEKMGYDFAGWYLEEVEFDFGTPVTEAITLVAKWEEEQISGPQTVIAEYEGATANMIEGNNATSLNLNENVFTVTSEKGQQGNHVGLNGAGQIRLYAHRASGEGAKIVIEIAEGFVITDVKFVFGASTNTPQAELVLGDAAGIILDAVAVTNTDYEANGLDITKFSLQNIQTEADNTKNGQVFILSIEITFEPA